MTKTSPGDELTGALRYSRLFCVTLSYGLNIPPFNDYVYASDEENAVVVCSHNATNKGWPKNFTHSTVSNIS